MSNVYPISVLRSKPRICIVGGGIVGSAAAFFLAAAGCPVTLLERDTIGSKASGVNFGGVRRHARHPGELPLSIKSHRIWVKLEELIGHDCDLETPGHLKLALGEEEMAPLEAWLPVGREHGLDARLLSARELAELYPWLAPGLAGASYCAGDGFANPRLVAPGFARAAREAGALIREGCPVSAIEKGLCGWVVRPEEGGEVVADIVINATGAWATTIRMDFSAPVSPAPAAPQMFVTEPMPMRIMPVLGLVSGDIYLRQSVRGNIIFGGGRGKISADGWRSSPGETPFREVPAIMRRLIPDLGQALIIRSWTGIEGHTPDGLPVIGACPDQDGLFQAWGFSGHGFQMGPGVGQCLSELVLTGKTDIDLSAFDPTRFAHAAARTGGGIH